MNIDSIRQQFPILERQFYGQRMIYLDNTASSQTPLTVVDEITRLYTTSKANVHRGVSSISQEATALQERTRDRVASFIGASAREEIIFTRGTTEAINLVASSYGALLNEGDEIILTVMEHHANIVPWQLLRDRKNIVIKVVPITADRQLDMDAYRALFTERTRLVSVCHVSNVLGTVNPVREIIEYAHRRGAKVMVDGAQALPHQSVNVKELDADFYAFSSHKMYGPTGIGVLYGKREVLEQMPPYQGGGEMIANVTFERTTYAELPFKFEAGTPDYIGIAALHSAIEFIEKIGYDNIASHEHKLLEHTQRRMLEEVPDMRIFGLAPDKCAVISFLIGNEYHYDVGMFLDRRGIAVRTGHHCAQPLMHALGVEGVVRASFAVYNTIEEADRFVEALIRIARILGVGK